MTHAIYIKPATWDFEYKTFYYVGYKPTMPEDSIGYRLGGYFIRTSTLASAREIADSEAKRLGGVPVIECEHIKF